MCQKKCVTNHVSLRYLKMCPQGFTLAPDIWLKTCGHMQYNHVEKNICRIDYKATCGENNANHVDKSMCKHVFMHVGNCMQTMWRTTCGDMI